MQHYGILAVKPALRQRRKIRAVSFAPLPHVTDFRQAAAKINAGGRPPKELLMFCICPQLPSPSPPPGRGRRRRESGQTKTQTHYSQCRKQPSACPILRGSSSAKSRQPAKTERQESVAIDNAVMSACTVAVLGCCGVDPDA